MPLVKCVKDGKPGWKWGEENKSCFTYIEGDDEGEGLAKTAAMRQAAAIEQSSEDGEV